MQPNKLPNKLNESVSEIVKTFIQQELLYSGETFDEKGDLVEQGIVDSLSLVRLISFVEERFQVQVRDEDLVADNFRSLSAIETYVANCLKSGRN